MDASLYRVFVYLAAFRMQELGAGGFRWAAGRHSAERSRRLDSRLLRRFPNHHPSVRAPHPPSPPNPRRLVESQDAQKMVVLLSYLFDGDALTQRAREDWLKSYDKTVRRLGCGRLDVLLVWCGVLYGWWLVCLGGVRLGEVSRACNSINIY
jgi:hypothetical protein